MHRGPSLSILRYLLSIPLVLIIGAGSLQAQSAGGTPDRTFGGFGQDGGVVSVPFPGNRIAAAAAQANGRIVVAGSNADDFVIARYLPDGRLDPDFGNAGVVTVDIAGGPDSAEALELRGDGTIIVAGAATVGASLDFALVKLNSDGIRDSAFNAPTLDFNGRDDRPAAIYLHGDGKIVVGGSVEESDCPSRPCNTNFGLARYFDDGRLDTRFGAQGRAETDLGDDEDLLSLAYLPSKPGVTSGYVAVGARRLNQQPAHLLVKYTEQGRPDTSFGTDGLRYGPSPERLEHVIIADNAIVAAGTANNDFALLQLDHSGTPRPEAGEGGLSRVDLGASDAAHLLRFLDTRDQAILAVGVSGSRLAQASFNPRGLIPGSLVTTEIGPGELRALTLVQVPELRWLTVASLTQTSGVRLVLVRHFLDGSPDAGGRQASDFGPAYGVRAGQSDDRAVAAAFQSDGRLIIAGISTFEGLTTMALARYTTDGAPDPSFGQDGLRIAGPRDYYLEVEGLAVQADGGIVVAGNVDAGAFVARFTTNGDLDQRFGGGYVTLEGMSTYDLAVQRDGKIVIAGSTVGNRMTLTLARFDAQGRLDPGFGSGGRLTATIGQSSVASALTVQPDGKILVAGYTQISQDSSLDTLLVRYNPDGTPDRSFGADGVVITDMGENEALLTLALLPDGRIATGGFSLERGMVLARYTADGALDPSFDGDGKLILQLGADQGVWDLVVDGDGLLVAACELNRESNGLLLRFTASGTLDPNFGTAGRVIPSFSGHECLPALAINERRIAAAGLAYGLERRSDGATPDMAVAVWERAVAPKPTPTPTPPGAPNPTPRPTPPRGPEHQLYLPLLRR